MTACNVQCLSPVAAYEVVPLLNRMHMEGSSPFVDAQGTDAGWWRMQLIAAEHGPAADVADPAAADLC